MPDKRESKSYVCDNSLLMAEWNQVRNNDLGISANEITCGSGKKVWWMCGKGHEWEATPSNRAKGQGCPYCAGKRVVPGVNDLATRYPKLVEEWDCEANSPILPSQIMPKTNKIYRWVCKTCGNRWSANPNSRTKGSGCPKCAKRFHSSFPEQAIFYYVKEYYPDAINSYKEMFPNNMELDIFIPSLSLGIEYDGEHAHRNSRSKKDLKKYEFCKKHDITLIRVREDSRDFDAPICDFIIYSGYSGGNYWALDAVLDDLAVFLPLITDHNVDADSIKILEVLKRNLQNRSLAEEHPELARQWNYSRNGNLTPEMFLSGNGEKVWWKCEQGHEWKAHIYSRSSGIGCPVCANKQVLVGYNDLATTSPEVLRDWDFEKNSRILPTSITRSVSRKVWWKCQKGHNYQMRVDHRTSGHGCPYCAGSKAIVGMNDLETLFPQLLDEWNYEMNKGIVPSAFLPGSERKVWWKCLTCGNVWKAQIANRTNGSGCPICGKKLANVRALISRTSKGSNFEQWCKRTEGKHHLLLEWSKRNPISSSEVTPKSYQKVLWTCSKCGYEWECEVYKRANHKVTCPVCLNTVVLVGHNDIGTVCPEIIDEWDYDKNGELKPIEVVASSNKEAWWVGKCGHSWLARISDRTIRKYGCPYCSNSRVLEGFNDLQSQNPKLAMEWCNDKNDLTPNKIIKSSHRKVWWKCQNCGNQWQATVKSRNQGCGCPICAGHAKTAVKNIDTGEVFESITLAAKRYNGFVSPISSCCKGKQETAYGFHWQYYREAIDDGNNKIC